MSTHAKRYQVTCACHPGQVAVHPFTIHHAVAIQSRLTEQGLPLEAAEKLVRRWNAALGQQFQYTVLTEDGE